MNHRRANALKFLVALTSAGIAYQLPGCGQIFNFARSINPCGSVLNCDPVTYRFLTSGYEGPGVDVNIDPACTFPPFCAGDPFIGGQDGG